MFFLAVTSLCDICSTSPLIRTHWATIPAEEHRHFTYAQMLAQSISAPPLSLFIAMLWAGISRAENPYQ